MKYIILIFLLLTPFPNLLKAQNQPKAQCSNTGGNQNGVLGGGGLDSAISKLKGLYDWIVEAITKHDPNQITGEKGYTEKQWVSIHDRLFYTIEYENDGSFANGAAQNVYIHFSVPDTSHININSLRLGNFGFGKYNFQVSPNTTIYTNRLDLRDSLNLFVDVTAGIDIINKEFFWILKSIDPLTGVSPIDGRGFLPPGDTGVARLSDTTGKGQGFVSFYANPQGYLKTQDTLAAQASIIFDINDPVPTNVWVNTIDAVAPTSHIDTAYTDQNIITLHWSGQDDPGGSGVRDYNLYVSDSGKTFTLYKSNIDSTSIAFTGTPGDTYSFFTLATDTTGNKETLKQGGDITVTLTSTALPIKWLYFTGIQRGKDVLLSWATTSELNAKEFIIERSLNGREFTDIGTVKAEGNSTQVSNYQYTDINAMLFPTKMLYYRLRQVDIDGRFIYSSIFPIPVSVHAAEPAITAYPNPFKERITLQIITVSPGDKTNWVRLTSVEGRLVYNKKLDYTGTSTILLQDLPQLANGTYILNVSVNGKLYKVMMVKHE